MSESLTEAELECLSAELYAAIETKNPDYNLIQKLMDAGADPHYHPHYSYSTSLGRAISRHDQRVIAIVAQKDKVHISWLFGAIEERDVVSVQQLLDVGVRDLADLNDKSANKALTCAQKNFHPDIHWMVAQAVSHLETPPAEDSLTRLYRQMAEMAAEITSLRQEMDAIKNPRPVKLDKLQPKPAL